MELEKITNPSATPHLRARLTDLCPLVKDVNLASLRERKADKITPAAASNEAQDDQGDTIATLMADSIDYDRVDLDDDA